MLTGATGMSGRVNFEDNFDSAIVNRNFTKFLNYAWNFLLRTFANSSPKLVRPAGPLPPALKKKM